MELEAREEMPLVPFLSGGLVLVCHGNYGWWMEKVNAMFWGWSCEVL